VLFSSLFLEALVGQDALSILQTGGQREYRILRLVERSSSTAHQTPTQASFPVHGMCCSSQEPQEKRPGRRLLAPLQTLGSV
jgi:hypothetical protein